MSSDLYPSAILYNQYTNILSLENQFIFGTFLDTLTESYVFLEVHFVKNAKVKDLLGLSW